MKRQVEDCASRRHALAPVAAAGANAKDYPSQDIRLFARFRRAAAPTCWFAISSRSCARSPIRTVIVENKVGAGGNIATEYVAKSEARRLYDLCARRDRGRRNQSLFKKPLVDVAARRSRLPRRSTASRSCSWSMPRSPYKTVAELTAAMKQKGDKASYATAAPTGRIMGEIYKEVTKITAVEVNYETAPVSNEMISGKVDSACTTRFAGAAARGTLADPGGEHRHAARGQPRHADHDRVWACRWT